MSEKGRKIVYGLCDLRYGSVRYVGRSSNGFHRCWAHGNQFVLKNEACLPVVKWIKKIRGQGSDFFAVVLENCSSDDDLNDAESRWILRLKNSGSLLNLTSGGHSTSFSEESRRKMSESAKKRVRYPVSAETRVAMSMAKMGHRVSEETRRKISNKLLGRKPPPKSDQGRLRISASKMGHSVSEDVRVKISRSLGCKPFTDDLGKIYQTQAEAARALGVDQSKISAVLNGRQKRTRGRTFRYIGVSDGQHLPSSLQT